MSSQLGSRVLGLLVTAFLAAGAGPTAAQTSSLEPSAPAPARTLKVALTAAPARSSFGIGNPVTINVLLTNQSGAAIGLSNLVDANLHVVSFTRDGIAVGSRPTAVDYRDDLAKVLGGSLISVPNGASLPVAWTSGDDGVLLAQALSAVTLSASNQNTATLYDLGTSGAYQLTFYYQFKGSTEVFPGAVFAGRTNSATISFDVF